MNTIDAIKQVSVLGLDGFQMGANYHEHDPENMSAVDRVELLRIVKSYGLKLSAICGDFGRGFTHPDMNRKLIDKTKQIIELALDLETNIVTTHIGVIPENTAHIRYKILQDACYELAKIAYAMGAGLAIETGPETAKVLKDFLDSLSCKGIGVNLDPANLVMIPGDDPISAVYTLNKYIIHTHAKDGVKLLDSDPEALYGDIENSIHDVVYFEERPLGKGMVDFDAYLNALTDIGYTGFLTIEREVSDAPADDIIQAVNFLRSKMNL